MLFSIIGCKSGKSTSNTLSQTKNEPKILFLNYTIEKTDNNRRVVSLINKKNFKKQS